MPRIAVVTYGSTGDVHPFLALAAGLRRAGHEVTLLAPSLFAPKAEAAGVAFRPLGPPVDDAFVRDLMKRAVELRDPIAQLDTFFRDGVCRGAEEAWATTRDAVEASDLVVSHITGAPAFAAAERLGRPLVTGIYNDGLVPSAHHGFPGLPDLGRWLNPLVWRVGSWFVSRSLDRWFNVYRTLAGLPPARGFAWGRVFSRTATLVASSPAACGGRRPDWPAHVHLVGEWVWAEPAGDPPPALARFVEEGPPPVLVSFGSTTLPDPAATTRLVVEAAARAGVRVVLQDGWAGLGRGVDLPPTVAPAGYLPYAWLLPRVAAVVHHAGAGTTGAVWRAGRPAVAVPQGFDQPFWAARVARLGTGVNLPLRRLTVRRLAKALEAVRAPAVLARCEALAARLRAEDGVGAAVRVIEQVLAR